MWRPPCTYVLICWYVSFPWIHSHELKDTSISNVRRCCWIVFQMVVIFPPSTSNVWEFSFPHSNTCCDCLLFCQSHGNKMILHFYFNLHFSIFGVSFLTPDQSLLFKLNILFFYWIGMSSVIIILFLLIFRMICWKEWSSYYSCCVHCIIHAEIICCHWE